MKTGRSRWVSYRKATHTSKYLDFHSHSPAQNKGAVVKTLLDRAKCIPPTTARRRSEKRRVVNDLGPVARSLVSANRWLRDINSYRFPWYLSLVSTYHASSNRGLKANGYPENFIKSVDQSNIAQPKPRESPKAYVSIPYIKGSAYYCYCAYVLRISRYSEFLSVVLTNAEIFLRGLKLFGESRT